MNKTLRRILLTGATALTLTSGYSLIHHFNLYMDEQKSPIRTEYADLTSQYNQEKSLMFTISETPNLTRDTKSIDSLLTTIDRMQELDRQIDSLENSDAFKQSTKRETNYANYSAGSLLIFCIFLAGILPSEDGPF